MAAPQVSLNNGKTMPVLGLGTWLAPPGEVGNAVKLAIDIGYRHFDCALLYSNEREIGAAIKEKIDQGVVKREDLFITSKLWNTYHRPDLVVKGCKKSLRNFGLDYLDLYLIHWPIGFKATDQADNDTKDIDVYDKETIFNQPEFFPRDATGQLIYSDEDYVDVWKEMEKCVQLGLTKSIGVSNFSPEQIDRVLNVATIKPVTNQIELHPYWNQQELRQYCKSKDIIITAYCPLGAAKERNTNLLENPTVLKIAKEVQKTPGQVVLRHLVQLGVVPIPKSTNPNRLLQNISVFDFQLSGDQIEELNKLDRPDGRICIIEGSETHKHFSFEDKKVKG